MQEKIKNRINALLSKNQENGCTEAEAMSAISKAKELMFKHQIEESDLVEVNECILDSVKAETGYVGFQASLAVLFDCKVYKSKKEIFFFGYQEDVELCTYFNALIIRSAKSETQKYKLTDSYKREKQFTNGRTLTASFRNGFLSSVSAKLKAMFAERKNTVNIGHGIVLQKKSTDVSQQFNEMKRSKGLNLRRGSRRSYAAQSSAFGSGSTKGAGFGINQGVKRGGQLKLN